MTERKNISFRILHPSSLGHLESAHLIPDLCCGVDFFCLSEARRFQKTLRLISYLRYVRLEKGSFPRVLWCVPWHKILVMNQSLAHFPEIFKQIAQGWKGYRQDSSGALRLKNNRLDSRRRPTKVMGILNVTPDSFSDGGRHVGIDQAVHRAVQLEKEGADWLDIGGESTRPGAKPVSVSEEKKRILPVIKACAKILQIPLSVDTYKAEVARAAVGEGAQMINDVSAMRFDPQMGKTVSALKVPVVLMHMKGKPRTMQKKPVYRDLMAEIIRFFRDRLGYARECAIREDRIVVDPGFGFGKTDQHNLILLERIWELKVLGKPILLGPSRKGTLGRLLGGLPPEERVEATAAAVTAGILNGANWVRVHDVQSMVRVVKIAEAIRQGGSDG